MQKPFDHVVYSKNVVEFVTVANEYCSLVENALQYSKLDFIQVSIKLLPLLYLKASMLPQVEQELDEELDETVDEFAYTAVKDSISSLLTSHDDYLEVFTEDFQRSDTPVIAYISEDMADIYQDVRNFSSSYRIGAEEIMNDALYIVNEQFALYWGQKLLNTLRALHNVFYSGDSLDDEEPTREENDNIVNPSRGWYDRFQSEWGEDHTK